MEDDVEEENWSQKAQTILRSGDNEELRKLLQKKPPTSSMHYVWLLVYAQSAPRINQEASRNIIFGNLDRTASDDLRSTGEADEDDGYDRDPGSEDRISIQGVFNIAMQQKTTESEQVVKRIWDEKRDTLIKYPLFAYYCLCNGFASILQDALAHITADENGLVPNIFHAKALGGYTAFEWAIDRGDLESVQLLSTFQAKWTFEIFDKTGQKKRAPVSQTPLHLAIKLASSNTANSNSPEQRFRALDIIKMIVDAFPRALCGHSADDQPAYVFAVKKLADLPKNRNQRAHRLLSEIESFMRQSIFEKLRLVEDVSKALYGRRDSHKEFFIDMSDFNQDSHNFIHFVDDLDEQASEQAKENDLVFESTLLYVYLPDLCRFSSSEVHTAVSKFFLWLEKKKVTTIVELNIPDNHSQPLSDEFVFDKVARFNVRKLDWRRIDMNLDLLIESGAAALLTDLHLYSSGNWSTLYHWASAAEFNGLSALPQIREIRLSFVEPKPSSGDKLRKNYRARFTQYRDNFLRQPAIAPMTNKITFSLDYKWSSFMTSSKTGDSAPLLDLKIFRDFEGCHTFLRTLKNRKETASDFERKAAERLKDRPIKVAIIDNGTDKTRSTLYNDIERGISFAEITATGRRLPWWIVADPHGTQMASLIQRVNPHCRLYPVRVGRGRNDIQEAAAIEALRWAKDQQVDIISISWVTKGRTNHSDGLIQALKRAAKNALVFCSTADIGQRANDLWTSEELDSVIFRVSASDVFHNPRGPSLKEADIMVSGEDIVADGPRYIKRDPKGLVTGSSVATALASGIASLSLCLSQILGPDEADYKKLKEKKFMQKIFSKMITGKEKVIDPAKLFQDDFVMDEEDAGPPPGLLNFRCGDYIEPRRKSLSKAQVTPQKRPTQEGSSSSEDSS